MYVLHINQQLNMLRRRGLRLLDLKKAKEVLLDIGYYRLGFYLYPFEQSVKSRNNRSGDDPFFEGATFEDAVTLYHFDFQLRSILLHYTLRLEVNFRTAVVYYGSLRYANDPWWFVNPKNMATDYVTKFDRMIYTNAFRKNPTILAHHRKHTKDKYAPAWKTIELMTMGEVLTLYKSILDQNLKREIAQAYGVRFTTIFENYMEVVRLLRNSCAHNGSIYDFSPQTRIVKGPAELANQQEYHNLMGVIRVMRYLLKRVSVATSRNFIRDIQALLDQYATTRAVSAILHTYGGIPARFPKQFFR